MPCSGCRNSPRTASPSRTTCPGVQAAVAAGVTCVAFPNTNTAAHDFAAARETVSRVEFGELQNLRRSA